jgi:hypothetical protein
MSQSPVGFEAAVDDLDPEERASFVAAVYDARGWESERVGTVVSVRRPAGGTDPRRVAPPGVTADDGVRALPLEDLRQMLRYAVAPADRARLCRRFFDTPVDEVELVEPTETPGGGDRDADESADRRSAPPNGVSGDEEVDTPARPAGGPDEAVDGDPDESGESSNRPLAAPPVRATVVLAIVLVCVVAVPFATWAVLPLEDGSELAPGDASPSVENTSEDADGPPDADATATAERSSDADDDPIEDSATGRQIVLERSYPPGVGVDGVANASALAAAHRSALSGRSYRVSITNREAVGGLRTAVAWEWTVVEAPSRYRSTVRVAGTFRWPPSGVANASTYANGTARVVRVGSNTDPDGTVRFESPPPGNRSVPDPGYRVVGSAPDTDPFAGRTASILRRALSGTETAVTGTVERDGTTYFRIEVRNASAASGADEGTLLVDERGLVHEIRYARTVVSLDSVPVRRTVTVRVTPGNVTLVSPPWYRSADAADRRRPLPAVESGFDGPTTAGAAPRPVTGQSIPTNDAGDTRRTNTTPS